jgi:hypothetical protein
MTSDHCNDNVTVSSYLSFDQTIADSPALYHNLVKLFRCSWRRWEAVALFYCIEHLYQREKKSRSILILLAHLIIGKIRKWSMPQTPYLIHDTAKAPHITGSGVLIIVDSLC